MRGPFIRQDLFCHTDAAILAAAPIDRRVGSADFLTTGNPEQKAALRQSIEDQTAGSLFCCDERLRRQREWLDRVRQVFSGG